MRGTSKPKAIELSLPYAPEMIDLVPADENFHGGVSIADATAEAAFEMIMLAYLNQEKSDGVRLYLNEELVDNTTIEEGKEAENTSLYIPPGRFHSGLNIARFGIKRISQDEVPTPDLKLLYRSVPPGGTPPVLSLRASHTSVGPDEADKFVLTVSYDKANWYDRIHVDCAGEPVRHQSVPQTTSPLPPVPASIDIPIPRSVFEQAGDSAAFPITFRVTDYLTNSSPSSLPLTVDVHLQRQQLPVAVFREVLADISDDPTEVNLGKMKGGPLWALLYLPNTTWQPEDSIHLKFTSVIAAEVAEHDVTLLKQDLPTYFNWEIPNVKVLRDSKVEMIYEQIRDGKIVGRSMAAIAQVIGNPTIELPPPTLSPPTVPVDVLANPNGVKLQVTGFTAEKDDKAQFVQVNAPAGAPPFPVVDFIDGVAEILLSAAFLVAWHGRAIEFRWDLIRAGKEAGRSVTLQLEVLAIKDGLENWETEQPMTFNVNNPVQFKSGLTFNILVSNNGWITRLGQSDDSELGNLSLFFGAFTSARFGLSFPAKNIYFHLRHLHYPDNKITFLDENLVAFFTAELPITGTGSGSLTFSAQESHYIHYFDISSTEGRNSDGGFYIDNLRWSI